MTAALVQRRPRPVFCVVESAYRDRAVAEAVCAGRFTHAGVTLDLGGEPDWLAAELPADAEWRIEWSKFYYGLDLAAAFAETGDRAFLDAWERLVRSWIRQVPVGLDASDVAGRRVLNWIYAWSAFCEAPAFPGLSDGADEEIFGSLAAQVEHLRRHLTPERNHRTLELYALFVAALALPELDTEGLLDFAVRELRRNLLDDVRPDGVHREHSTHYHMTALKSYLGALENARRFGVEFADDYRERLALACEFAAQCRRPDGTIPALSDSDTGDYTELLELAEALLGIAPSPAPASFPDGGYYVQRHDDRFLIFDCGALGDGGHGHYDSLGVEIAAGHRSLVVDPGRYTYSEEAPNWRRWFKGTAAHNTVCVDGLDQTPYRCGKPKGPVAETRLVERVAAPGLDVLRGEVTSPCYDAVHTRRVLFVAGEYWIVADSLRAPSPHRYDLRFHLAADAWERTELASATGSVDVNNPLSGEARATQLPPPPESSSGAMPPSGGMALAGTELEGGRAIARVVRDGGSDLRAAGSVVRAPGVALVFDRAATIEDGWVSPVYGIKHPAPVVSVAVEDAYRATFVSLVVPIEEGSAAPRLRVLSREAEIGDVSVVEITHADSTVDLVAWSDRPRKFELGGAPFRATAAWARTGRPAGDAETFARHERGSAATERSAGHRRPHPIACRQVRGDLRVPDGTRIQLVPADPGTSCRATLSACLTARPTTNVGRRRSDGSTEETR